MLTLEDITAAVPTAVIGEGTDQATSFPRASIDTRDLAGGELFVAITGAARDGHDFIDAAVSAGAAGLLVSRDVLHPFCEETGGIHIEAGSGTKNLRIAGPSHTFVSLRAVRRHVQKVAALTPLNILL